MRRLFLTLFRFIPFDTVAKTACHPGGTLTRNASKERTKKALTRIVPGFSLQKIK
jgi:hypothetical protein